MGNFAEKGIRAGEAMAGAIREFRCLTCLKTGIFQNGSHFSRNFPGQPPFREMFLHLF